MSATADTAFGMIAMHIDDAQAWASGPGASSHGEPYRGHGAFDSEIDPDSIDIDDLAQQFAERGSASQLQLIEAVGLFDEVELADDAILIVMHRLSQHPKLRSPHDEMVSLLQGLEARNA